MLIRPATNLDRNDIRGVYVSAFPEGEKEMVSKLALNLLSKDTMPPTLSYVAENEDAVVGHVAFSSVTLDGHENVTGYILAPLGIQPAFQKRRIGSTLIENGLQELSGRGVHILFVYGDPDYYSRFGFTGEAAERYIPPYSLQYPFGWLGIVLNERGKERSPVKIDCVTALCDPALW